MAYFINIANRELSHKIENECSIVELACKVYRNVYEIRDYSHEFSIRMARTLNDIDECKAMIINSEGENPVERFLLGYYIGSGRRLVFDTYETCPIYSGRLGSERVPHIIECYGNYAKNELVVVEKPSKYYDWDNYNWKDTIFGPVSEVKVSNKIHLNTGYSNIESAWMISLGHLFYLNTWKRYGVEIIFNITGNNLEDVDDTTKSLCKFTGCKINCTGYSKNDKHA